MDHERVLVVDDEPRYLRLIRFNLEAEGYRVDCGSTGEEALALLVSRRPSLVMLDIMLPGIDGFEVLRRIRELSTVPVIMLTALGGEEDKVRGLREGADDYITKPFSAQELLARVEAVLRRARLAEAPAGETTLSLGDLAIDFLQQRVTLRDREVSLSPTEYRLLCCLASGWGKVHTHDEVLEKVWGAGYEGEQEMLRVAVWRLRQKIEDDASRPSYVRTRPGVGYMLASP